MPQVALGQRVAQFAHAMMDVSDGLLLDASRMAEASGVAVEIDTVPLSDVLFALRRGSVETRLSAASAGDDYVLLAAIRPDVPLPEGLIPVGRCSAGSGLTVRLDGVPIPLPTRLGWMHG
jgi:thiamine-monophosphate kinase